MDASCMQLNARYDKHCLEDSFGKRILVYVSKRI